MNWQDLYGREKYQAYLASREWALKREAVRQRSGGICEHCKRCSMSSTHHVTYARIFDEQLEDLLGVCEECHRFLSGKGEYLKPVQPIYIYELHFPRLEIMPLCQNHPWIESRDPMLNIGRFVSELFPKREWIEDVYRYWIMMDSDYVFHELIGRVCVGKKLLATDGPPIKILAPFLFQPVFNKG